MHGKEHFIVIKEDLPGQKAILNWRLADSKLQTWANLVDYSFNLLKEESRKKIHKNPLHP